MIGGKWEHAYIAGEFTEHPSVNDNMRKALRILIDANGSLMVRSTRLPPALPLGAGVKISSLEFLWLNLLPMSFLFSLTLLLVSRTQ